VEKASRVEDRIAIAFTAQVEIQLFLQILNLCEEMVVKPEIMSVILKNSILNRYTTIQGHDKHALACVTENLLVTLR
jgi:hypothetical protein